MTPAQRLEDTASRLCLRLPFLATIFSSMRREVTDKIPTAATNGMKVMFNAEWMEQRTDDEMLFVAAHEAMHVALLHSYRLGDRNPELWNIAADAVINAALKAEGSLLGTMPNGGVLISWVTPEMDTEEVYKKLMEGAQKSGTPKGAGGWDGTGDLEAPSDPQPGETETEVKTLIAQAAKVAFAQGDKSQLIERILGVARESTTDWREETREMLSGSSRDDYTYRRLARRFVAQGIYLPSLYSEALGKLVVGVDTSWSMTQDQLDIIAGDLSRIVEDCQPEEVVVIYCDASVNRVDRFSQGEAVKLQMCGGGGTRFHPVFDKVTELDFVPAGLIYFTDMEGSFDFPGPDYPVLWGAVNAGRDGVPSFGRRVEVRV